jgi:hypothetical protein
MVSVTDVDQEFPRRERATAVGRPERGCRRRCEKRRQEDACCKQPGEPYADPGPRVIVGAGRSSLLPFGYSLRERSHDLADSAFGIFFLPSDARLGPWTAGLVPATRGRWAISLCS